MKSEMGHTGAECFLCDHLCNEQVEFQEHLSQKAVCSYFINDFGDEMLSTPKSATNFSY